MSLRLRLQEKRARDAERPFWQRGLYLPLLITVVLALGAAALFLVFSDDPRASSDPGPPPGATQEPTTEPDGDPTTADDDATSSPPDGNEPPVPPEAGACVTPPGTGDDALSVAPEVQWSPVGNAPTASSTDHGPTVQEGPKRCYSQTAAGALIAAHNFVADISEGRIRLAEIVESRVSPEGPIFATLMADVAAGREGEGTSSVTVAAYRFLESGQDEWTVSLIHSVPSTSGAAALMETRLTVRWIESDWVVWDGTGSQPIGEVPAGYVQWGPLVDAAE